MECGGMAVTTARRSAMRARISTTTRCRFDATVAAAVASFFFSSRRRHTRCLSDWSPDVCSSDLLHKDEGGRTRIMAAQMRSAQEVTAMQVQNIEASPARRGESNMFPSVESRRGVTNLGFFPQTCRRHEQDLYAQQRRGHQHDEGADGRSQML